MNRMKRLLTLITFLFVLPVSAEVKLAGLFSDGMILQQKMRVPVWGWAESGLAVKVSFAGQNKRTKARKDGKWMLYLAPMNASAVGAEMEIVVGGESKVIKDVLVGEVWLCSGQSNMGFLMNSVVKSPVGNKRYQPIVDVVAKEIASAHDPLLRQVNIPSRTSHESTQDHFHARWVKSSPASNGQFSATGYYFGRELRRELGVPVALIKCTWGGSRVQAWIPAHEFQGNPALKKYYQHEGALIRKRLANWDEQKQQAAYAKRLSQWKAQLEQAKREQKVLPKRPLRPNKINIEKHVPSTAYNGMLHALIPYAIKGAIWYQGESNSHHQADEYGSYLALLINSWRRAWHQGHFPFYYAQLANYSKPVDAPVDRDGWATVCDQQRLNLKMKNTGMAVLNDIGEAEDIHPKNKMDVGKRLALWALAKDYGQSELVYSGPLYKESAFDERKVTVRFSHVGQGLMVGKKHLLDPVVATSEPLKGFQICGADRQWKWAEARIISSSQVEVSHPAVKNPVEVRYAWAKNVLGTNLYNRSGLPASVFKVAKSEGN